MRQNDHTKNKANGLVLDAPAATFFLYRCVCQWLCASQPVAPIRREQLQGFRLDFGLLISGSQKEAQHGPNVWSGSCVTQGVHSLICFNNIVVVVFVIAHLISTTSPIRVM